MKYLLDSELAELKDLERKLHEATPHYKQAAAIGKRMARVYAIAKARNNPPNPVIDRAMKRLSSALGIK